jgi:hypothetical protein
MSSAPPHVASVEDDAGGRLEATPSAKDLEVARGAVVEPIAALRLVPI